MNPNQDSQHDPSTHDSTDYRQIRIDKIAELEKAGYPVYPERFTTSHTLDEAKDLPDETKEVRLAGRIMSIRIMGKLTFMVLQDASGRMQIAFQKGTIPEDIYDQVVKKLLDMGDFVGIQGSVFTTHKGEKTVLTEQFTFLGKGLRVLPDKFHGIRDQELQYRQRYLDLIMNRETVQRFKVRSQVVQLIREFLLKDHFEEVETPILQNKASGAIATPFRTHHNALDIDIYLRIAPETYLKRLVVAGYNKVFEFAKCFRNEGMDPSHLQEFTMLEYYCAYWNYEDNMNYTEKIMEHVLSSLFGSTKLTYHDKILDFTPPYPRKTFRDLLKESIHLDIQDYPTVEALRKVTKDMVSTYPDLKAIERIETLGYGNLLDQIYKKTVRDSILQPMFLIKHPIELSPLARRNDQESSVADRFQLVVNGWEIVNAYSELVDPLDQRKRLEEQSDAKAKGDQEAHPMDEDYLLCMEYGMPPISGWGMGIDRFLSLITASDNLRDVVFFPLMRPHD